MKGSAWGGWLLSALVMGGLGTTGSAQVTFLPPMDVAELTNDMVFSWDAGDVDGDGLPDVIFTGFAKLGVISNEGDGRWEQAPDLPVFNLGHRLAELTGDGILDLLAPSLGAMEVQPGLGDGTFGAPIVSPGPAGGFGSVMASEIEDFSGDGHPDLVALTFYLFTPTGPFNTVLTYHEGVGGGTFLDPVVLYSGNQMWTAQLEGGDLDGDGDPDLLLYVPEFFGNGLEVRSLLSNGDGTFTQVVSNPPMVLGRTSLADLDGDGLPDFLGEGAGGNTGYMMPGNGDGTFGAPTWAYDASGDGSQLLETRGDFDGDGLGDMLRPAGDSVEVWLNAGDGTFSLAETLATGNAWLGVFAEDLNADGRCDVVANVNNNGVTALVVVANTTYSASEPFEDRGDHLIHEEHRTLQMASGALLPGAPYAFAASDLPQVGVGWMVLGAQEHGLPFAGGSIGPSLDIILGPVDISGSTRWTLDGLWPSGVPSGTTLYSQFWVRDGTGTFASTGTVEVDVP
jgi:hypothetical protein